MPFHSFTFYFSGSSIDRILCASRCMQKVGAVRRKPSVLFVCGLGKIDFLVVTSILVYGCSVFIGKQYERMQHQIDVQGLKGKGK